MNAHQALTASLDQHARDAQARYHAMRRQRWVRRIIIAAAIVVGVVVLLKFLLAFIVLAIIGGGLLFGGGGGGTTTTVQPQPEAPRQQAGGWDYHGNRATVAASRGEHYQVPDPSWGIHDVMGHAKASGRGNAWVPGIGEIDPNTAAVHYTGPGRDAWWYTSRGMQPPR